MKRFLALFLALALLAAHTAALGETGIDLTFVREHPGQYELDEDDAPDTVFVESGLNGKDLAFSHPYESSRLYSIAFFDVLVMHSDSEDARAVPRMWIYYAADEFLHIESVTVTVDGLDYTFSDVSSPSRCTLDENGAEEDLVIRFGTSNRMFLTAMERWVSRITDYQTLLETPTRMVLHGTEDLEVELPGTFLLDFLLIMKGAYVQMNGPATMDQVPATPMSVTVMPQEP